MSWRRRVPAGFAFSIKAPRALTHGARLYAPERWLARIGADLVRLGEALGVLLVQLPPDLGYDPARLRYFLGLRPACCGWPWNSATRAGSARTPSRCWRSPAPHIA